MEKEPGEESDQERDRTPELQPNELDTLPGRLGFIENEELRGEVLAAIGTRDPSTTRDAWSAYVGEAQNRISEASVNELDYARQRIGMEVAKANIWREAGGEEDEIGYRQHMLLELLNAYDQARDVAQAELPAIAAALNAEINDEGEESPALIAAYDWYYEEREGQGASASFQGAEPTEDGLSEDDSR